MPGRRPADMPVTSSSVTPGTSSRASRSSSHRAPAVTRVSNPISSCVAPSTISPSPRGTMYALDPWTIPRTQRPRNPGAPRSRMIWPLTGRTGGRTSGGRPSREPDQAPAASTTRSAATAPPPASRTPRTTSPSTAKPVTRSPTTLTPRRASAASSAAVTRRGSTQASPGARTPPRTEGASIGSARRHSRPVRRSTGSESFSMKPASSPSAARSSAPKATSRVPSAR